MANFISEVLSYRDYLASRNTNIFGIHKGTVSINPALISANESGETAVTIPGVSVGDEVLFFNPSSLETGLAFSGSRVSAANTVQHRLSNVTEGSVTGTARTWNYLWFDLTDPGSA